MQDRIVPQRPITGMSAVLLAFTDHSDIDWAAAFAARDRLDAR